MQQVNEQLMPVGKPIKVIYKNWRAEVTKRSIIPRKIYWGSTEWHQEDQWLPELFDVDRSAVPVYALKDIQSWCFD